MEWSIDLQGESPFEVGSLVLRIFQDRYMARIDGYDVSDDGEVSATMTLPSDPWTRRIVLHWARVDRNRIWVERARRICETATDQCRSARLMLNELKVAADKRIQLVASPRA